MTTTETAPTLTFLQIDPARLQVNPANVRRKTRGLDDLAASIAKVGVLVPLIVRSNGTDDTYLIVAGERRALAAVKAKAPTVPVIVHAYDDQGQAELTAMMVENLHREDLTPADEAKGFEQLAAFGITVADIAQLTGREPKRVETGLTIARSEIGTAVAARYDLTLEQAAVIAEFDTDKNTVKELTFAAQKTPDRFEHVAQRARQERERLAARAVKTDELQSAGVKILGEGKRFGYALSAKEGVYLSSLVDGKGKNLTPAGHKSCPGHAAEVDHWGRHVEYGCTDPRKHGHKTRMSSSGARSAGAAKKAGPSAAEKEKAAKAKLRTEADEKAMEAATVVRRKFVRDLLARKTPPKGTLAFAVPIVLEYELYTNPQIIQELTGVKTTAKHPRSEELWLELTKGASEARLQVLLLALIACTLESDWGPYLLAPAGWQSNKGEAKYLQFLESCGYGLSEIEQRMVAVAFPPAKAKKAAAS